MNDLLTLPFGETEQERWLPVPDYEGLYDVSDLGNVRSLPNPARKRGRKAKGVLSPSPDKRYGYLHVCLRKDGKPRTTFVHVLVLTAFVGPRPEGQVARHGPGGQMDNRLANLRWGTQAENIEDKDRDGTMCRGDTHALAILTEATVNECRRRVAAGERQIDLAREFGVSQPTMNSLVTGRSWKSASEPPVAPQRYAPRKSSQKLTADLVTEIRARSAAGETNAALAAVFGVTPTTISLVVRRHVWQHVA